MPSPTERSPEEREAQAARNRRRLLAAEAAAVALLLRRRKEAVDFGIGRGFSAPQIAVRIQSELASGIAEARVLSRLAGIKSLTEEIEAVGGSFESVLAAPAAGIPRDIRRARTFADSYAKRWLRKAEGETVAKAARVADTETGGSLERIAVTESSEALNDGRDKAADEIREPSLLKVWDAQLDKLTCPICGAADGTIVGIKENFPHGQPGAVHPWCRCTWRVLTFSEHGSEGLIEPKAPGRVISLPTPAAPAAPKVEPVKAPEPIAKQKPQRVTKSAPTGYVTEQAGDTKRATAYERMVSSRVVPEALRNRRLGAGFRRATAGLDESELRFLRSGYRAQITPYADVSGLSNINDVATGRVEPPGSSKPLPPIKLGITGKDIQLVDGRHRLEAAQLAGATEIRARIYQYDRELNVVWEGERVIPLPKPDAKNPHGRR